MNEDRTQTQLVVDPARVFICPQCGRIASVAWAERPICMHSNDGIAGTPEIWDGNNTDGNGRKIEESPNEKFRVSGAGTWAQMIPWFQALKEAREYGI